MTTTKTAGADLTVTSRATHQDAQLLVQILNGPVAQRAAEGLELLWGYEQAPTYEQFAADHPVGSPGSMAVNAVLNVNEMVGTFVKQGLLDAGLVYDLLWVRGAWERCKAIALQKRAEAGEPRIYENFEALALGQP